MVHGMYPNSHYDGKFGLFNDWFFFIVHLCGCMRPTLMCVSQNIGQFCPDLYKVHYFALHHLVHITALKMRRVIIKLPI